MLSSLSPSPLCVTDRTCPTHSNDVCCLGTSSADAPRTESHESDFEAPTNGTKGGGHSEPHQSAGGARHVCDDADLPAPAHLHSATCGASAGRRSKIVHTSRGSTGAALAWRKNLWPISSASAILLKLSMDRPPVLA